MNFGSPTEAARISIEKVPEQSVTKVPILAVQTRQVYNIQIPEAQILSQSTSGKEIVTGPAASAWFNAVTGNRPKTSCPVTRL